MVGAGHGRGMESVNQTRPHCVNQTGERHSKPLAARHGMGAAWARHALCESAFTFLSSLLVQVLVQILSHSVYTGLVAVLQVSGTSN